VTALHWHYAYARGRPGPKRTRRRCEDRRTSSSGARGANPTARFDEEKRPRGGTHMLGSSMNRAAGVADEWRVWPRAGLVVTACVLHVACHACVK